MKTQISAIFITLCALNAMASENIYRIKGAEMVSYGVQVDAPKRLRFSCL